MLNTDLHNAEPRVCVPCGGGASAAPVKNSGKTTHSYFAFSFMSMFATFRGRLKGRANNSSQISRRTGSTRLSTDEDENYFEILMKKLLANKAHPCAGRLLKLYLTRI